MPRQPENNLKEQQAALERNQAKLVLLKQSESQGKEPPWKTKPLAIFDTVHNTWSRSSNSSSSSNDGSNGQDDHTSNTTTNNNVKIPWDGQRSSSSHTICSNTSSNSNNSNNNNSQNRIRNGSSIFKFSSTKENPNSTRFANFYTFLLLLLLLLLLFAMY